MQCTTQLLSVPMSTNAKYALLLLITYTIDQIGKHVHAEEGLRITLAHLECRTKLAHLPQFSAIDIEENRNRNHDDSQKAE
jgi:hypothetical protein